MFFLMFIIVHLTDVYLFKNETRRENWTKTLMSSTLVFWSNTNFSSIQKSPKNLLHNIHNNAIQQEHNFPVQKKGAIVAEKRAFYVFNKCSEKANHLSMVTNANESYCYGFGWLVCLCVIMCVYARWGCLLVHNEIIKLNILDG